MLGGRLCKFYVRQAKGEAFYLDMLKLYKFGGRLTAISDQSL